MTQHIELEPNDPRIGTSTYRPAVDVFGNPYTYPAIFTRYQLGEGRYVILPVARFTEPLTVAIRSAAPELRRPVTLKDKAADES